MSTGEAFDVAAIASVPVDQCVDDPHRRASTNQFVADVRADETQATGDHADGG